MSESGGIGRIRVHAPGGEYPILVGEGLLGQVGEQLQALGMGPGPAALVTHPEVGAHYAEPVLESLRRVGFEPAVCEVPQGEESKTLTTVSGLYERYLEARLDRRAPVVGLGGGVIGDLAGFSAATYLRGVPVVHLPTTLLAMVDSSVGGKTAVDLAQGKNLVGAFKQPSAVLADPSVLETLPEEELCSGLGEIVKHALIDDVQLFSALEVGPPDDLGALVERAVRVKVRVVEQDPFDTGRRAVLNLGHTFGHAFELVSEYTLRHGEAVAVGLVAAAHLGSALEQTEPGLAARIADVLTGLGLSPTLRGYDPEAVYAAMAHDKKRRGKLLRFLIPERVGSVRVIDDPGRDTVLAALGEVLLP